MSHLLDLPLRAARRWVGLPDGTGELVPAALRPRLALSVVASLVMSLLDLAGVLALVPMMQFISGSPRDEGALGMVSRVVGEPSDQALAAWLAGLVVGAFVLKNLLAILLRWWQMRFMASYGAELSTRMVHDLMAGPYHRHLTQNSADKAWIADSGVQLAYTAGIGAGLSLVSEGLTIAVVFVALLVVSPWATLIAILYFGTGAGLLYRGLRARSKKLGDALLVASQTTNRTLLEAVGAVKEIKLRRAQDKFLRDYREARTTTARVGAAQQVVAELPKYLLEILMVLGIGLMAVVVTATSPEGDRLVILGVFAAASTKIVPAFVRLIGALNSLSFANGAMRVLIQERRETLDLANELDDVVRTDQIPTGDIVVSHLGFAYPSAPAVRVVDDLSLTIRRGESVALVGGSGAGKSTLVDLILGLHRPVAGSVTVGGLDIWDNLPAWQAQLAVVPQDVFLLDATLGANITFDLEMDADKLRVALDRAQLTDLVDGLDGGIDSLVGQRGMRLSGGQRQRIGIARALYREPDVLILDEATSALDNETEFRLSETIRSLHGSMTMIIVAHRLSTVKHCDKLAFMKDGQVAAEGTFAEVASANAEFANLVRLGSLDAHSELA